MRSLALAAALALVGCATAPQPKMSWAEAVGAEAPPPRPLLAMAGNQVPDVLPRYVLGSSIVTVGGQAAVLNGYALCTFNVQNSSGTVEASIDCAGAATFNNNVTAANYFTNAGGSFRVLGSGGAFGGAPTDGPTAIALILNSYTTLANGSAKIASFQNNSIETSYVAKDGAYIGVSASSRLDVQTSVTARGGAGIVSDLQQALTFVPVHVIGETVDGATAIGGVRIDTNSTMSTAGSKIATFENATVVKAFVDKDGYIQSAAKPVPADITNSAATAIQHGTGTCAANTLAVTFPTAFASGTPAVTGNATTAAASAWNANGISNTGFTAKCAGATDTFNWTAIGLR